MTALVTDPLRSALSEILAYSADDYSWVATAQSAVERHFPGASRESVRTLTAALVEALLAEGLIEVGLPTGDGATFLVEGATPEEVGRRIYEEWNAGQPPVQAALWMNATPLGHAVQQGTTSETPIARAQSRAQHSAEQRDTPAGDAD